MTDTELSPAGPPVIAVVGPTASGKSALGVAVAQRVGGEVVNADSMQLYRHMDIGTAKVTIEEQAGVTHHLLSIWPVTKSAAVAEYQAVARATIDEIRERGRVPVLVGGSGLYLRGVLDKLDFPGEAPHIRRRLQADLDRLGAAALHERLRELDPEAADQILPTNGRRVVRALEVIEITGRPFIATMPPFESIYPATFIALDRPDLDERVAARVQHMMQRGFLAEVQSLLAEGIAGSPTASKALGYQQLLDVLGPDGAVIGDVDAAAEATIRGTLRFVRRQRSWFRRDPRLNWLDASAGGLIDTAMALLPPTLGL